MVGLQGRKPGLPLAVCAAFAFGLGGCVHDDCRAGQFRCEEHAAWYCGPQGDDGSPQLVWLSQDCGEGACALDDKGAFCALENAPNAGCDGGDTLGCIGTTITQCRAGYVTFERDCVADAGASAPSPPSGGPTVPGCVSGDQGSFCVPEPKRDPACAKTPPGAQVYQACSGNEALECAYGFAAKRTSCNDLTCECNEAGVSCTQASCVAKP